jgi:hypothetical protein
VTDQQHRTPARTRTERKVARFPLVCRARLICPDLKSRIAEVCDYAHACQQQTEPASQLHRACAVWNLAALIAADCDMPALAAQLCERQFRIFHDAWPVTGRTVIASLQPLVNLARLTARTGDPTGTYRELTALDRALHDGGSIRIHGTAVSFEGFTAAGTDRIEALAWLRVVLVEDGTRLLASTDQWVQAAAHAALCDDAKERLRDSRQTQVIARLLGGHAEEAVALIDTAVITEPWEHAVAACLRVYSELHTNQMTAEAATTMLAAVHIARQATDPATGLFRIRLGLAAVDLVTEPWRSQTGLVRAALIRDAQESQDALIAREILRDDASREQMSAVELRSLTGLIDNAGLGRGDIPKALLADLMAAVETAETVLAQTLGVAPR